MAGGGGGGRSLEQTPTWAVAVVCFIMVLVSIIIEHIIHLIGQWLKKKNKRALYESLEKIKSELMLLGFISLLLTIGQAPISKICIAETTGSTWHPCDKKQEEKYYDSSPSEEDGHRRKLFTLSASGQTFRRILATAGGADKCPEGKVPFVSSEGINQLHLFIFVLAVFHVMYCILTMALGRLKMRSWKHWEKETRTFEYQFSHDPERFRIARETSFGRRHLNFWSTTPGLIWIVCFFRQLVRSVPKIDYLTLRHGFIMEHMAPQNHINFNFQKYINRSLHEDFKVVVGISPPIWFLAVLFLLFNTHGWYSYLWLPFIPLIIILLIGMKLQVIITKMGLRLQDKGEVVKGVPTVKPGDNLFWFNRPRLILYLINFVLFQNAFQLAFFFYTWFEFGLKSCFHEHTVDIVIRVTMGVLIQILCSYVTLPLYALVTQMGSTMKPVIFNERVAVALKNWHRTAKKHVKHNNKSGLNTPMSSRQTTPTHGLSPVHLLSHYKGNVDSIHTSPRKSNFDVDQSDNEGSTSPSNHHRSHRDEGASSSYHHGQHLDRGVYPENESTFDEQPRLAKVVPMPQQVTRSFTLQHEIDIVKKDFSFDKITST